MRNINIWAELKNNIKPGFKIIHSKDLFFPIIAPILKVWPFRGKRLFFFFLNPISPPASALRRITD